MQSITWARSGNPGTLYCVLVIDWEDRAKEYPTDLSDRRQLRFLKLVDILEATARNRTADILITSEVLYQLSYGGSPQIEKFIAFFLISVHPFMKSEDPSSNLRVSRLLSVALC